MFVFVTFAPEYQHKWYPAEYENAGDDVPSVNRPELPVWPYQFTAQHRYESGDDHDYDDGAGVHRTGLCLRTYVH